MGLLSLDSLPPFPHDRYDLICFDTFYRSVNNRQLTGDDSFVLFHGLQLRRVYADVLPSL